MNPRTNSTQPDIVTFLYVIIRYGMPSSVYKYSRLVYMLLIQKRNNEYQLLK